MKIACQLFFVLFVFLGYEGFSTGSLAAESEDSQWKRCLQLAGEAYDRGSLPLASTLYEQALSMAERFGDPDQRLALTLHKLGSFYLYRSPAKAASYFRRSLAVMETLPRDKVLDLDLAMENGLLCETLMAQKKYAEAEQYAKKKLALEESLLHSDDAVLVHSLTLIGDCEIQQEQFAGAEPFYKRASEIARLQKFPTLGNLLLTLARTEAQLKEFSKAETYKQQALAVKHKANQVEFAENMRRLGVAFMRKQQWAEADACYQEAAEILASIHQDSSPTMAMLTANRGRLCYRQEQYAQAEILYQKAMSMIKTTNRPVNKEVWNGMAEVLEKEGKTDQASKLREQLKATASDVAKPVPH